jgi:hypothetical protein
MRVLKRVNLFQLEVYTDRYGFTGPTRTVTVEQAKTYAHRTSVIVSGNIVQAIGGDLYIFRDTSGEIILRIGPREWYALGSKHDTKLTLRRSGGVYYFENIILFNHNPNNTNKIHKMLLNSILSIPYFMFPLTK